MTGRRRITYSRESLTGMAGRTLRAIRTAILTQVSKWMPSLAVVILIILVPNSYIFDLDSSIYDVQTKLRFVHTKQRFLEAPHPKDEHGRDGVIVILVDDETLRSDSERLLVDTPPVTRQYLARLVANLVALKPSVIALDFFLDRPSNQAADQSLTSALVKAQTANIHLVLPMRFTEGHVGGIPVMPIPQFLIPLDPNLFLLGHANIETSSSDGVVRRVPAGRMFTVEQQEYLFDYQVQQRRLMYWGNKRLYSLSLPTQVLRSIVPELRGDDNVVISRILDSEPMRILFVDASEEIKVFSSASLNDQKVLSKIANSIVIIGPGFSESPDRHLTPLSTTSFISRKFQGLAPVADPMPGSVLIAHSFVTLREFVSHSRRIVVLSEWWIDLLILLLGIGLLVGLQRLGRMRAFGATLVLVALIYWIGDIVAFQRWLVCFPVIGPSAVIVGCYLLGHMAEASLTKNTVSELEIQRSIEHCAD
jgi:CHASE2 domain-containing sensor protein